MSKSGRSAAVTVPPKTGWQLENPLPATKVYPFIKRRILSERTAKERKKILLKQKKEATQQIALVEQNKAKLTALEDQLEILKHQKTQIFDRLRSSLSNKPSHPLTPNATNSGGIELASPGARLSASAHLTGLPMTPNNLLHKQASQVPPARLPLTPSSLFMTSHDTGNFAQQPSTPLSAVKPCAMVRPTTKESPRHTSPGALSTNNRSPNFSMPARFTTPPQHQQHSQMYHSQYSHFGGGPTRPRF